MPIYLPGGSGDLSAHEANPAAHGPAIDAALLGLISQSPDALQGRAYIYEEFFGSGSADGQVGKHGWRVNIDAGTGSVIPTITTGHAPDHPGVYTLGTGTDAAGRAGINMSNLTLEGTPAFTMEWLVAIGSLGTLGSNESVHRIGSFDSNLATTPTDGIYFKYDLTGEGVNWQACAVNAGTETETDTGVPVVASAWVRLRIVSDGGGNVYFYIDDTTEGNHAALLTSSDNLPIANALHGPNMVNAKTFGTTGITDRVDYFWLDWAVTR